MSTTQVPTRVTPGALTPAAERQPVWKHGVAAAVVASVATTVLAAIRRRPASRSPTAQARASRSPGSRS